VPTLNQPGRPVSHVNPSRARKQNSLRKQQSWLMHHTRQVAKKNVSRVVVVDAAIAVRVMPVRKPLEKRRKMQRLKRVQVTHPPRSRAPLKSQAHPRQLPHPFSPLNRRFNWKRSARQTPGAPWQPIRPIYNRLKPRARQSARLKPANRAVRVAVVAPRPSPKPRLSA